MLANPKNKKQLFLLYDNNRMEFYCSDSSILQIRNQSILYISPKGIKNVFQLSQVHKIKDLYNKFKECLYRFNRYNQQHLYLKIDDQDKTNLQENSKQVEIINYVKLSIKINQFCWRNPEIVQNKEGYEIKSDCSYASVVLKRDLYIVEVTYLQYLNSQKTYSTKQPNMTKFLLQKYNYTYEQFPTLNSQKQNPAYFYKLHTKIFTIFTVPNSWKYPLYLIWSSLLTYKIIDHQFCYIQYTAHQMSPTTVMPEVIDDFSKLYKNRLAENKIINKEENDNMVLPILGKINHNHKCLFLSIENCYGWYPVQGQPILADSYGFWTYNDTIKYRKFNCPNVLDTFYPKAIPYTLRFQNQPERSLKQQLNIFLSYLHENKKLQMLKSAKNLSELNQYKFDNQNNLVKEQSLIDVGNFKAYSNGIIVINFVDRSMLTLNAKRMQVKIIYKNGQICYIDLSKTQGVNYKQNKLYIEYAIDFMERVFYIQHWLTKQQVNQSIEQVLQNSSTSQKVSQIYLKL